MTLQVFSTLLCLASCISTALTAPTARQSDHADSFEYIVIGSGPGGGPLAANLAEAGHTVLLLEAGGNKTGTLNHSIPAFFGLNQIDPEQGWFFYVNNFEEADAAALDEKLVWSTPDGLPFVGSDPPVGSEQLGIFYPRAGTLGGCDTHNGGIVVVPPAEDWDSFAEITGDDTWRYEHMRSYYEKIEDNLHVPVGTPGHGFGGYLGVDVTPADVVEKDPQRVANARGTAKALGKTGRSESTAWDVVVTNDINGAGPNRDSEVDVYQMPFKTDKKGRRSNAATRVNQAFHAGLPLTVRLNSLVSRVLLDDNLVATGVEYLEGTSLYKADPRTKGQEPNESITRQAFATREVIVAGGAFNSPQILLLSGIGPAEELQKHNIPVRLDLPGVGKNLQDHYEIAVIDRFEEEFSMFGECRALEDNDPCFAEWQESGGGPYRSTGFDQLGKFTSSVAPSNTSDVIFYSGPGNIVGFLPPELPAEDIVGAYTHTLVKSTPRNRAGTITLRSNDPRDVPDIQFRLFTDGADEDLQALAEGVQLMREVFKAVPAPYTPVEEVYPGPNYTDTEDLKEFIKSQSFGHHPASTCAIGADDDPLAVLDSNFRVRGIQGLRVVDASAFPNVPGSFPVIGVFMISEKASDVILRDAHEWKNLS